MNQTKLFTEELWAVVDDLNAVTGEHRFYCGNYHSQCYRGEFHHFRKEIDDELVLGLLVFKKIGSNHLLWKVR